MNYIPFLLPPVALAVALLVGFDPHYWWAYTLIAAAAEGLLYLFFYLNNSSTEYLSGYATTLIHHFPWTERKEKTESREVGGKTRYTTKVSYINHDDEYFVELNTGKTISVNSVTFSRIKRLWNTPAKSIHVHHSNCASGGGGEQFEWNEKEYLTETFTYTHRYRNPVKNSVSPLRGPKVKKDEAISLGLFKYPELEENKQKAILVDPDMQYQGDTNRIDYELQHLNAFCGADKQIHIFMLLFPANAGSQIAEKQRGYWKGCNKNELVVCLGVDGNTVEWCETLSWMDDLTLDREVKEYFRQKPHDDLADFVIWLRGHLDLWKRKEVKSLKHSGMKTMENNLILWGSALAAAILVFLCAYWIGG